MDKKQCIAQYEIPSGSQRLSPLNLIAKNLEAMKISTVTVFENVADSHRSKDRT